MVYQILNIEITKIIKTQVGYSLRPLNPKMMKVSFLKILFI